MKATESDYYRILQVHIEAEQEVIDAAYRRLMRKYHPDVLDSSQHNSSEVKLKVQEINEAHDVLGNVQKRAQYDATLKDIINSSYDQNVLVTEIKGSRFVEVEKRIYPGKCARTKQSFQIHLARRKDSSDVFRVIGFSSIDKQGTLELPSTKVQNNFVQKLFGKDAQQKTIGDDQTYSKIPEDQELLNMFDESLVLDFGSIDWAGFLCPVCKGVFAHPDGTLSSWTICGKCSKLYCAGNINKTLFGGITICPWCGTKRQITYHVPTGTKANKSIRGILSREEIGNQNKKISSSKTNTKKILPPSKIK